MTITVWGVFMTLVYTYLAMAFVKFALMASSVHVAAGVHMRLAQRRGFSPSYSRCYIALLFAVLPIAFIGWPMALIQERFQFFVAYSRRAVIKDVLADYRAAS